LIIEICCVGGVGKTSKSIKKSLRRFLPGKRRTSEHDQHGEQDEHVTLGHTHYSTGGHVTKEHLVADCPQHGIDQGHVTVDQAYKHHAITFNVTSGHTHNVIMNRPHTSEQRHLTSNRVVTAGEQKHVTNDNAHTEYVTTTSGHAYNGGEDYTTKDHVTPGHSHYVTTNRPRNVEQGHLAVDHMVTDGKQGHATDYYAHKNHMNLGHAYDGKEDYTTNDYLTSGHSHNMTTDRPHNTEQGHLTNEHVVTVHKENHVIDDNTYRKHVTTTSGHAYNAGEDCTTKDHMTPGHIHKVPTNRPLIAEQGHLTNDKMLTGREQSHEADDYVYKKHVTVDHAHDGGKDHLTNDHVISEHSYNVTHQHKTANDHMITHRFFHCQQEHVTTNHSHNKQVTASHVNKDNAQRAERDHVTSGYSQNVTTSDYPHHDEHVHVTTDHIHNKHVTLGHAHSESFTKAQTSELHPKRANSSNDTSTAHVTEKRAQNSKPNHVICKHTHNEHVTTSQVDLSPAYQGECDHVTLGHCHRANSEHVVTDLPARDVKSDYAHEKHATLGHSQSGFSANSEKCNPGEKQTESSNCTTATHVTEIHAHLGRTDHVITDNAHDEHVTRERSTPELVKQPSRVTFQLQLQQTDLSTLPHDKRSQVVRLRLFVLLNHRLNGSSSHVQGEP